MIVNISTKVSPKGNDKMSVESWGFFKSYNLSIKIIVLMETLVNEMLSSQDSVFLYFAFSKAFNFIILFIPGPLPRKCV